MAVKTDPTKAAANWAARFAGAGQKATEGANAVTVSPGALAARQAQVWAANVASSVQKFARRTGAVTLEQWRSAYIETGIPRFASGAQKGQPKMANFMAAFLPVLTSAVNALPARGNYEQNKARAIALMDKLHGWSYQGAGQ